MLAIATGLALAFGAASQAAAEDHSAWPEKAKPMVRFIEEVWNKGDYAAAPDLFARRRRRRYEPAIFFEAAPFPPAHTPSRSSRW